MTREAWTHWIKTNHFGGAIVEHRRPSTHKYAARSVRVDGILFDSQREAARYHELKMLLNAGMIADLEIHPGWPLIVSEQDGPPWIFHTIGMFHADFRYRDRTTGTVVVEDVKSKPTKTEAYKLRKRFVEARYKITIVEIE